MDCCLAIKDIYRDPDIVEIEVSAWNGLFAGSTRLYVGPDEIAKFAEHIRSFPIVNEDQRLYTMGVFDERFAGGGASFRFYSVDRAGHCQVDMILETGGLDASPPQKAAFSARVDPASIDEFVSQLIALQDERRNSAALVFSEPVSLP